MGERGVGERTRQIAGEESFFIRSYVHELLYIADLNSVSEG